MSEDNQKSYALKEISEKVAETGNCDRAFEIANSITDEYYKSSALRYIERQQNP